MELAGAGRAVMTERRPLIRAGYSGTLARWVSARSSLASRYAAASP